MPIVLGLEVLSNGDLIFSPRAENAQRNRHNVTDNDLNIMCMARLAMIPILFCPTEPTYYLMADFENASKTFSLINSFTHLGSCRFFIKIRKMEAELQFAGLDDFDILLENIKAIP